MDRYTILDTGSTDGTPEIIKETFSHIPGDVSSNYAYMSFKICGIYIYIYICMYLVSVYHVSTMDLTTLNNFK